MLYLGHSHISIRLDHHVCQWSSWKHVPSYKLRDHIQAYCQRDRLRDVPIPTFVTAVIIPIGRVNKKGMSCVTRKPHHGSLVSHPSHTMILQTIMMAKRVKYHQSGTSRYFLYSRAWISSSLSDTARNLLKSSRWWKRRVCASTAVREPNEKA